MIGMGVPRTEEGTYSEDPEQWSPEVIGPGGEYQDGETTPDDLASITDQYMKKADDFEKQTTLASETFNKRMRDWTQDEAGRPSVARLLSQNFWSTFDKTIYGGAEGVAPADAGDGRNILAAIDHRLNAIADIKAGVDVRRLAQGGDELRGQVLEMQTDALASLTDQLWQSNPQSYMRNLSLVYSGDPDLMMINPLGIGEGEAVAEGGTPIERDQTLGGGGGGERGYEVYPAPLAKMFDAYQETANANANIPQTMEEWIRKNTRPERPEQGVNPLDMLKQKWPLIELGPEAMHRAAWMRKQVRDTSHFYGLTSPKTNFEVPMPEAQLHHVEDYGEEVNRLMGLKEALMRMIEIKQSAGMEGNTWEQVSSKPGLVEAMDDATTNTLLMAGQLYGSDRFVTKDERMSAAYDVGQATKMEIFGKILFLAQAWKAFLAHRMPQLVKEQGIDPSEIGLGVLSAITEGFVRLASMSDEIGNHGFADVIDGSLVV